MTRILFWNIETFALNKIADPSTSPVKKGSKQKKNERAKDRLAYIRHVFDVVKPQVIVVVEVETGYDARGRLARGAGLSGSVRLLDELRGSMGAAWMLIPPIQTGPKEAVAVYYDSTRRFFTGPYRWPGGAEATAAAAAVTGDYPSGPGPDLMACLPDPKDGAKPRGAIPQGAQYNIGRDERRCAARTTDFTARVTKKTIPWGDKARAPYMVTFAETNAKGTVVRNLTLFAVHAPASAFNAPTYMEWLSVTTQIVDARAANEVRVVLGDFNVNLLDAETYELKAAYKLLPEQGYKRALDPLPSAPTPLKGYPGYFATHIRGRKKAACWGTTEAPARYPGYAYTGSDQWKNFYAIDNIFVWGAKPTNFTVLNPIVGTPLDLYAPSWFLPRLGGHIELKRLTAVPPYPAAAGANPPKLGPPNLGGVIGAFRGWKNYGRIRSASDHLALAIDV
ncbi:MAG: hypothetical protein M3340_02640 [Actinomycetota bacterium]|nr:hypothetical protein [Actinomycetota bacterium]